MIVLGLDPSTTAFGWAIVESGIQGNGVRILRSGVLKPKASHPLAVRMAGIWRALEQIIDYVESKEADIAVDAVAVEEGFAPTTGKVQNQKTAMVIGMARGQAYTLAGSRALPVAGYAPATVKKAIAQRGNATKVDMLRAVNELFPSDQASRIVNHDQADAVAVAVTHLNKVEEITILERLDARSKA